MRHRWMFLVKHTTKSMRWSPCKSVEYWCKNCRHITIYISKLLHRTIFLKLIFVWDFYIVISFVVLYIQLYTIVKILMFVKYFKEYILSSFMIPINSFCPRAERESVGTSHTLVIVEYDVDKDYCDIIYLMYFYFPSICSRTQCELMLRYTIVYCSCIVRYTWEHWVYIYIFTHSCILISINIKVGWFNNCNYVNKLFIWYLGSYHRSGYAVADEPSWLWPSTATPRLLSCTIDHIGCN